MNWEKYREEIASKGSLPEDWYVLGIDLGTTNSVISFWDGGSKRPEPIDTSNGFGKIPLPSVVQYRPEDAGEGEWVVGEEAWRSIKIYPETTIRSIKRKMGTDERVELGGKALLPEEISAKILTELVDYCQSLNPKAEIAGLVVSVPYDFDDSAKKATMRAVEIAGLGDKLICLWKNQKPPHLPIISAGSWHRMRKFLYLTLVAERWILPYSTWWRKMMQKSVCRLFLRAGKPNTAEIT